MITHERMDFNAPLKADGGMPSVPGGGPESVRIKPLAVVLLSGSADGRRRLADVLAGTPAQVTKMAGLLRDDEVARAVETGCDVLIVDVSSDTEQALDLVEAACNLHKPITVMVYTRATDSELLLRCMRVGARECLTDPLTPGVVAEALVRASVRRDELQSHKKSVGRALVFVGAKGGSGVTTIAANFAVALEQNSGQKVALVDLNLPLGDQALALGLHNDYSTVDALQNEDRLDSELLSKLLVRHPSGLAVLAGPDYLPQAGRQAMVTPTASGVAKVLQILRNDFDWVVLDAGCHYASYAPQLFEMAERVYLVTQVSVPELRNCNRVISAYFEGAARHKLEVVLNRLGSHSEEFDEATIAKVLMTPSISSNWRLPNDTREVRAAQNEGVALMTRECGVTRVLTSMARAACGKPLQEPKKKRLGLFAR